MTPPVVEILDEDALYRRLLPYYVKADGKVSSAAYKRRGKVPDNEVSVDLARLTTPVESLRRAPNSGFALGFLLAAAPRRMGFEVRHDPCPPQEPDNLAHSPIAGENTPERCILLAEATTLVVPPPRGR